MNKIMGGLAATLLITLTLGACTPKEEAMTEKKLIDVNEEYLSAVDVDYAFDFTKSLEEFKTNEKLGYRTAGSEAELKTGEKIAEEMKKIGLTEVTKDEFSVDTWEFEKAD